MLVEGVARFRMLHAFFQRRGEWKCFLVHRRESMQAVTHSVDLETRSHVALPLANKVNLKIFKVQDTKGREGLVEWNGENGLNSL